MKRHRRAPILINGSFTARHELGNVRCELRMFHVKHLGIDEKDRPWSVKRARERFLPESLGGAQLHQNVSRETFLLSRGWLATDPGCLGQAVSDQVEASLTSMLAHQCGGAHRAPQGSASDRPTGRPSSIKSVKRGNADGGLLDSMLHVKQCQAMCFTLAAIRSGN